jgi:hypothetical protein
MGTFQHRINSAIVSSFALFDRVSWRFFFFVWAHLPCDGRGRGTATRKSLRISSQSCGTTGGSHGRRRRIFWGQSHGILSVRPFCKMTQPVPSLRFSCCIRSCTPSVVHGSILLPSVVYGSILLPSAVYGSILLPSAEGRWHGLAETDANSVDLNYFRRLCAKWL